MWLSTIGDPKMGKDAAEIECETIQPTEDYVITDFAYVYHTLEGITQVSVTFSEDFNVDDSDKQQVFTFGRILSDIGDTFVPINDFSRDRQLIGFTTV